MNTVIVVGLLIPAVIHLLPVIGVFGPKSLASLYEVTITDRSLDVLMRHRAVLIGSVGIMLTIAAFHPPLRPAGFVLGFLSIVSYLFLTGFSDGINASLLRVAKADWIALFSLTAAAVAYLFGRTHDLT
jgi:hypothetical protein